MRTFMPIFALLSVWCSSCSQEDAVFSWLTLDKETYTNLSLTHADDLVVRDMTEDFVLVQASRASLDDLPQTIHDISEKCGGYFASSSYSEARELFRRVQSPSPTFVNRNHYRLSNSRTIDLFLSKVDANRIRGTIQHLSQKFRTRHYQSETGVQSQAWLAQLWRSYNVHRRQDFNVKLYQHTRWKQPSVIASITGHTHPDEIVIIGGHGDSIARFYNSAPGADDNASGISSLTEAMRVILSSTYRPSRTLVFISYAAEEVGLLGSREIAQAYKKEGHNVMGVMQLDMTNHRTKDGVISFIRDHTDNKLSLFTQGLTTRYLPEVKWVDDRCGYACSDHASWNAAGFPAVFPFESRSRDMNRNIHTSSDTLENSDSTAQHAAIFAKIALAYAMEIAK